METFNNLGNTKVINHPEPGEHLGMSLPEMPE